MMQVNILYGSETGTAESFANELSVEAKQQLPNFKINCENIDDIAFDSKFKTSSLCVFIMSSTGAGEAPANARKFENFLSKVGEGNLINMKFTLMGLGDMNYGDTYQLFPKFVLKSLQKGGAELFYKFGEGDDCGDIEEDFENWKNNGLWDAIRSISPSFFQVKNAVDTKEDVVMTKHESPVIIFFDDAHATHLNQLQNDYSIEATHKLDDRKSWEILLQLSKNTVVLFLGSTKRLFRLVNLNMDVGCLSNLNVSCISLNDDNTDFEKAVKRVGMDLKVAATHSDDFFRAVKNLLSPKGQPQDGGKINSPTPRSVSPKNAQPQDGLQTKSSPRHEEKDKKTIIQKWIAHSCTLAISRIVKFHEDLYHIEFEKKIGIPGSNVEIMPQNCKTAVQELAQQFDLGLDENAPTAWCEMIGQQNITVKEALTNYADVRKILKKMDTSLKKDDFVMMKARPYTLSASNSILIALTEGGITSNMFINAQVSDTIRCSHKNSPVPFPSHPGPILMIATGAGVGMMRGFLRQWEKMLKNDEVIPSPTMLLYGLKDKRRIAYGSELKRWQESGLLHKCKLAFSRQDNEPKQYVQDLMKEYETDIRKLSNGRVVICGNPAMVSEVNKSLLTYGFSEQHIYYEIWTGAKYT